jgi:hypothetical protein
METKYTDSKWKVQNHSACSTQFFIQTSREEHAASSAGVDQMIAASHVVQLSDR